MQFFDGDNGGATWKGVTANEIRIALPACFVPDCAGVLADMATFFNRRFEFYGRTLRLMNLNTSVPYYQTPEVQRAMATRADEELRVFASLPYHEAVAADSPYFDELARRQIIGVAGFPSLRTERDHYTPKRPYQWSFTPTYDDSLATLAEWLCESVVGHRAERAGGELRSRPRSFAVLVEKFASGTPRPDVLRDGLRRCSTDIEVAEFQFGGVGSQQRIDMRLTMSQFKNAGVTTIACLCQSLNMPMQAADSLGYLPEWLMSWGTGQGQENTFKSSPEYPVSQRASVFGLGFDNTPNELGSSPWWWAVREGNPARGPGEFSGAVAYVAKTLRPMYQAMLLLASGIQAAGPNLTPANFEKGLIATEFPNPGAGGPPYYQARVGFGTTDHSMIDDVGVLWWDETAPSYESQTPRGGYCYLDRGRRFRRGQLPSEPMRFDASTCR